ncbi:MAG: YlbF family regulator [Eubacteriales bacterium]|nr:YlbF family regulator [Bacillota bacterium]MBV1727656.1 YlbF family regulator [Desulforudis sp.]MDQ7789528.1 YlbF family regulator [Clostridia bacterium]MDZ4041972.1 YlbF family regulator [Eubacteriales bacterium]MBU4532718.1 YlbF family regulator [Bacillota bacterium]
MSQEVMTKAAELGRAISESPESQLVRERQGKMFDNTEALEMLKTFQVMQNQCRIKQEKGEEVTQDEAKALEAMELKMQEHRLIREFFEAQNALQEMLKKAMQIVVRYDKETQ